MRTYTRALVATMTGSVLALGLTATGAQAAPTGSIGCLATGGFRGTITLSPTTGVTHASYTITAPAGSAAGRARITVTDYGAAPDKTVSLNPASQDGRPHAYATYPRTTGKVVARFVFDGPGSTAPTCTASNVI